MSGVDLARRVEALETELAEWKAYAAVLENGARPDDGRRLPRSWGLQPKEREILLHIYDSGDFPISRYALWAALYGTDHDGGCKSIDVQLVKLRKRVSPMGVTILNHWGEGWTVAPEGRLVIGAALIKRNAEAS
jgi:DNA-binding response OmpR family regulator